MKNEKGKRKNEGGIEFSFFPAAIRDSQGCPLTPTLSPNGGEGDGSRTPCLAVASKREERWSKKPG
jgi:hypothetical protein